MTWSIIRCATESDTQKLNAAATRFLDRHEAHEMFRETGQQPMAQAEDFIAAMSEHDNSDGGEHGRYLRRLWLNIVRRATGEKGAEGIAYGYVGYRMR